MTPKESTRCNIDPKLIRIGSYAQHTQPAPPVALSSSTDGNNLLKPFRNTVWVFGERTVAALLVARCTDVILLRTLAGNLDYFWLNKYNRISHLEGSLNPVDFADRLASIHQRYFFWVDDWTVPPEIYQDYLGFFMDTSCLAITVIPGRIM